MSFAFLKTKIGASLVIALLLIGAAGAAKIAQKNAPTEDLRQQVGLLADASVKEAIKNGEMDWEKSLQLLGEIDSATSTVDDPDAYASSSPTELTATDRFARELFTLYAQAKQNGEEIDEATAEKIAELALSNDYSGQMPLITTDDIAITTDTSRARVKSYGNAVGKALSVPSVPGDQELIILERIMNDEIEKGDVESLILILKRYQDIAESLKSVVVPQDAAAIHIDLINGISYLSRAVEGILSMDADPIASLTKIRTYEDGIDLLTAGGLGLRSYFISKNVTFSSDERGYVLTR